MSSSSHMEAAERLFEWAQGQRASEAFFRPLSTDPDILTKHPYTDPTSPDSGTVREAQANARGCADRMRQRAEDLELAAMVLRGGVRAPVADPGLAGRCRVLSDALGALGVQGGGYCWCATQQQAAAGHTGECREAGHAMGMECHGNLWASPSLPAATDPAMEAEGA